jgi:CTP:phosphocholine cytidylyltransferase-like protein
MHKINNAVILAAGYSSRFVPICFDMPKGLLPINGVSLIERQIHQLHDIGINDITVVTGAYAEQFIFLTEKYDIRLIFNPDYAIKNNFASIYAARNVLGNTIISSSDLYFRKNIFQNSAEYSYYASVFMKDKTEQRSLTLDENDKITGTAYGGKNTWITFGGQALFLKELSEKLISIIHPVYDDPEYSNKYWVDIMDEHLDELPMHIKRIDIDDIVEFNTLESLWKFDSNFCASDISPTMHDILDCLKCNNERKLSDIMPIKENNNAVGCSFLFDGKQYKYIFASKIIERC